MSILRSLVSGARALFDKEQRNHEIDEELQGYFHAAVEEKMRRGMDRDDAERAVRVEIGSAAVVRHRIWSGSWESTVESLGQDVRFGVRQLLKSPGFSLVAILSLALGIGANTAIFTLINDLLLKSLPVHDPQQLVSFGKASGGGSLGSVSPGPVDMFTYDFYKRIEREHVPFEGVCALSSFSPQVSVRRGSGESGAATQANSSLVSGTFFSVLGAEPILGRAINGNDTEAAGRNAVAVLSYRYWQQALSADPSVIGRNLTINGTLFMVIGVMPASFYGVELNEQMPDMWLPHHHAEGGYAAATGIVARRGWRVLAAHDCETQGRRECGSGAGVGYDAASAFPDRPGGNDTVCAAPAGDSHQLCAADTDWCGGIASSRQL
jgi:hypothetical protein